MTLQEPLISVIVPVYKVEEYIHKCVDSILNQTYSNLEIILVNDGSPDRCPEICDEYAGKDSRVIVIHKPNLGVSAARNEGLDVCRGEYIAFVDSDDFVAVDYIHTLYTCLKNSSSDLAVCAYKKTTAPSVPGDTTDTQNKEHMLSTQEALENLLYLKKFDNSVWAKLYKRELFQEVRFPKGVIIGEDLQVVYQLFARCRRVCFTQRVLYFYRQRQTSIMHQPFNPKRMQLIDICDEMLIYIKQNYPQLEKAAICRLVSANFHIYLQIPKDMPEYKPDLKRVRLNIIKYRNDVLVDRNARKKVRLALVASYLGFPFVELCFCIFKRSQ